MEILKYSIHRFIMKKNDVTGRFDKIMVKLPCYRIAYAVLSSLGVVMRNEKEEVLESPVIEEAPRVFEKGVTGNVHWSNEEEKQELKAVVKELDLGTYEDIL
jgi:hypothetical protein